MILPQLGFELIHVAVHHRHQVGVERGGGGAFILADLGQHFGRGADHGAGQEFTDQRRGLPFMRGVDVGVEEGNRDCLDPLSAQRVQCRTHIVDIK